MIRVDACGARQGGSISLLDANKGEVIDSIPTGDVLRRGRSVVERPLPRIVFRDAFGVVPDASRARPSPFSSTR